MTNPIPGTQMGVGSMQGPRDGSGPRGQQLQQQLQQMDQTNLDQTTLEETQQQTQRQQQQQAQQQSQVLSTQETQAIAQATGMGGMLNLMA
jgi:nitric oxide reductase large subunit